MSVIGTGGIFEGKRHFLYGFLGYDLNFEEWCGHQSPIRVLHSVFWPLEPRLIPSCNLTYLPWFLPTTLFHPVIAPLELSTSLRQPRELISRHEFSSSFRTCDIGYSSFSPFMLYVEAHSCLQRCQLLQAGTYQGERRRDRTSSYEG